MLCPVCGASLQGRRRDARYCGAACRRAASPARAAEPARELWVVARGHPSPQRRAEACKWALPARKDEVQWWGWTAGAPTSYGGWMSALLLESHGFEGVGPTR